MRKFYFNFFFNNKNNQKITKHNKKQKEKKHSTLENTWSLQVASWNNDGTTQMYGCKCSFE